MELTFGSLAFAGLIVAQFLAVIAVHRARLRDEDGSSALALHRKLSTAPALPAVRQNLR